MLKLSSLRRDDDASDPLLFRAEDDADWGRVSTSDAGGRRFQDAPAIVESVELRARGGKASRGGGGSLSRESSNGASTMIIERTRSPTDTLQKIALRYSTTVSELKRVNGIMSDQVFYGLTTIKIPVSRFYTTIGDDSDNNDDDPQTPSTSKVIQSSELDADSELLVPLHVAGGAPLAEKERKLYLERKYQLTGVEGTAGLFGNNTRTARGGMGDSGEGEADEQRTKDDFARIISGVDASLAKGKTTVALLQQQQLQREECDDGSVDWHFVYASEPRSDGFIERNIRHYLIVILCVFLFIGIPAGYILYELLGPPTVRY